jgi:HD-like signal output (HDOD) protein
MLTNDTRSSVSFASTLVLPSKLQQLLRTKVSKVRMFPEVAAKALDLTKDPDCSISEFVSVVERDVMLASEILRIANSVLYSQGKPITSLQRAVVRIGFRQCRSLIVTASMFSLMQKLPVRESSIRDALSRHSTLTSTVAASLNRMLGLGYCGEELAAGLLHDLGRLLLASIASDAGIKWDFLNFEEDEGLLEREVQAMGTTHCMVGLWFSMQNRLPQEFLDVIAYHHRPARAPQGNRLVALITLADQMANHVQTTDSVEGYVQSANEATDVLEASGITRVVGKVNEVSQVILTDSISDAEALRR